MMFIIFDHERKIQVALPGGLTFPHLTRAVQRFGPKARKLMEWTHPFITGLIWAMMVSVGTITQRGRVHNADDNIGY